nr:MAG TPA: hypothetical protein [Caudoviricetes sp.]
MDIKTLLTYGMFKISIMQDQRLCIFMLHII